jgi:hypothetical protein
MDPGPFPLYFLNIHKFHYGVTGISGKDMKYGYSSPISLYIKRAQVSVRSNRYIWTRYEIWILIPRLSVYKIHISFTTE